MPSRSDRGSAGLTVGRALALGALHGPAELLPISSSGHVALAPWLLGWDLDAIDGELRKAFEVALHGATALALLIALRSEVVEAVRELDSARLAFAALSLLPPAVAGVALERPIERRLGTPATIAAGLACGAVAMALADRAPQARSARDVTPLDGAWLGLAQACALVPGVSRNGATLAAARMRRFTREDANRLSRHAALPVIAGATALKGLRLARRGLPAPGAVAIAAGAAASFGSTLGATRLIAQVERDRSLLPYAAYRLALAGAVWRRLRASDP
ncbi:MAG: undecaprenyl-diphosphate phosphatase [Solirubrobacteraceae bacterium]